MVFPAVSATGALSLALLAGAFGYHQFTTLIDLYPFNNVRHFTARERRREALANAPVMIAPPILLALAMVFHAAWLAYGAAALAGVIFVIASLTWWPPYLFGRAFKWAALGDDWNALHERTFAHTLIVVPRFKGRPRPNLEHNILHLMILAGAITAAVYAPAI